MDGTTAVVSELPPFINGGPMALPRSRSVDQMESSDEDAQPTYSFGAVSSQDQSGESSASEAARLPERGMVPRINKTPKDFFFIKTIGEGAYSTVYQVKEVDTGHEYAIKVIAKDLIKRQRKNGEYSLNHVIREKNIMASLTYAHGGHPFVVSLYCTFQDEERLYFAMSFAKKGELLTTLNRLGSFDVPSTRFYAAEVISGLQFLHKCGVVHRDLKPENILFNESGHIAISDFGSAKKLEDIDSDRPMLRDDADEEEVHDGQRRSTFVGTAQYVSPEMLIGGFVGPACDFWALGAIVFQMLAGQAPFRAVNDFHLMKKIQNLDFTFPDGFPEVPKDLVSRMLVLEPSERLGSIDMGDVEAIMEHPFFEEIDWDILPELPPPELHPYIPASGDEPEFYSDLSMEPGLDEKALSRLLGFKEFGQITSYSIDEDLSSFQGTSDTPTMEALPGIRYEPVRDKPDRAKLREEKLEKQRKENIYHRFVDDNLILKSGLLDKKKGLFARRRMFLLTEGPHLYYIEPSTLDLKGEIPWSACMKTEVKNFRTFFIHTPNRTYYLFDPERKAVEWCRAIDMVKARYQNELAALGESVQTVDPLIYKKNKSPPKKEKKEKENRNKDKKGKEAAKAAPGV